MSNKMKNMRAALLFFLVAVISLSVSAQNVAVTGTVTDKTGETVIGASVVEKGNAGNGTITDIDGNFSLNVPANATLVFSYVGMKSQEIALKGKTKVDIVMEDDAQALEEVVVIGYGTVQKKDLTGSVASVSAKQLESIPVSSASEALQGKMAGVQITTTEGSPDADIKIRVRGGGSLSQDNSPLYIVDGFPVSSISDIAPTDIQSVDVLKDASSTAIYGARGANGVIIITTKSGAEGKTQVNFGASYGFRNVIKQVGVLDPYEFSLYQYELDQSGTSYGAYKDLEIYKSKEGSNWQDQLFGRTGNQQQYNISVSGGTKSTKFNISYARNDEKSIMRGSGYSKNNINAKINTEINKWLSLDFNARLIQQKIDGLSGGADNESSKAYSLVARAITHAPVKALNEDSEDDENSTNARYTPLERVDATYKQQRRFRQDYNVGINWEPLKGLKFRSEFGYGWKFDDTDQVWGYKATANSKFGHGGLPQAYLTNSDNKNWRNANTLTYENKKLFNGRDRLNVMIGHEVSTSQDTKKYVTSVDFSKDATTKEILAALGNGTALPTSTYIGIKDNLLSFFGRANYTLMDKYLFTFTMRADGSSKFAPGNKWSNFASGAIAWRASEEEFIKRLNIFSNLKVRASYGQTGNQAIGAYATRDYLTVANYPINGALASGFANLTWRGPANPDLKWETTSQYNVGVDMGFFKNRVNLTVDLYYKKTSDLLQNIQIPQSTGFSNMTTNFGNVTNKGLEISGKFYAVATKDFNWDFDANISFNRNKISGLPGDQFAQGWSKADNVFLQRNGLPIGTIYGFVEDGFYDNIAEVRSDPFYANESDAVCKAMIGEVKYKDLDGVAGITNADRQIIGDTNPDFTFGMTHNFSYKNFSLSFFLQGCVGGDIFNANLMEVTMSGIGNIPQEMYNTRWTPENRAIAKWPKAYAGYGRTMKLSDRYVEDGSYLRMKNINLGYKWIPSFKGIESVNLYVSVSNVFTISGYSWFDPDVNSFGSDSSRRGVDMFSYPSSRTFSFGLQCTF